MTLRCFLCSLAACSTLLCSHPGLAQDSNPYLASISIERADADQPITAGLAQLTLHVRDPVLVTGALSSIDGIEVIAANADTVSIQFVENPTVMGQPDDTFRRNTFVIDFDEESILSLDSILRSTLMEKPSTDNLVSFVYEHIENKNYSRTFDLASRVAESGEGDCTEHAVLLTALARSSGYYARVVFGILIVDTASASFAYGHAWSEIHDGTNWQIEDATMPELGPSIHQVRYLPVAILDDEGPGFSLAMFRAINSLPAKITGFANQD